MPRAAVAAIPLLLVPALGVVQGGFHPDTWVWSGALAAWAAALGLTLGGGSGLLRRDFWWVLAAAALLLWTLSSSLWSAEPAQSLLEARRMLVYGAAVLALVVLARRDSARVLLLATNAAVAALVLYALARYLLGARTYLEFEGNMLSEPLGYANALGILAAMGILLSLGTTAESTSRWLRGIAGALVPPLALALELTASDASWLALAIGFAAMAALQPSRRSLARTSALVLPPSIVAVWIGHHSELTSPSSPRMSGTLVAFLAVGCAAVAAYAAALTAPTQSGPAPRRRRLPIAVVAVAAALGAIAVALRGATEPRRSYYHVAWSEYLSQPLLGSGAGTFGHFWLRSGDVAQWGGALDAHSLYLETLAELGPIGLCLLAVFLLYPLKGVVARRGLAPVPAAAGATLAFLVHAGLDWDWELPAVVLAGLSCAAVVAFAQPEGERDEELEAPRAARAVALAAALLAGAAAIAGARSATEPSASSSVRGTSEAPRSGASLTQQLKADRR